MYFKDLTARDIVRNVGIRSFQLKSKNQYNQNSAWALHKSRSSKNSLMISSVWEFSSYNLVLTFSPCDLSNAKRCKDISRACPI